jgi:hypothetical protein
VRHGAILAQPIRSVRPLKRRRPPADTYEVDAAPHSVPYRRIGTILVDRELITGRQLEFALTEQQETGRPLGEICVERFGLDRLSLADALAEQWDEIQQATRATEAAAGDPTDAEAEEELEAAGEATTEDELRVLLAEAQAARLELTVKTDELGKRLAALETLVVGVSDALSELRSTAPDTPRRRRSSTRRAA